MKNTIIIILISLSFTVFSQNNEELVGIWLKVPSKKEGVKFNNNGGFELYNPKDSTIVQISFNVKYKISTINGINFIDFLYYKESDLVHEERKRYKIENKKLYLSKENNEPKKNTIVNYTDVYVRLDD